MSESSCSSLSDNSTTSAEDQSMFEWFLQAEGGKTHFVLVDDEWKKPIPMCRERGCQPFDRPPVMRGTVADLHLLTGRTSGAHTACLERLSPSCTQSWQDWWIAQ